MVSVSSLFTLSLPEGTCSPHQPVAVVREIDRFFVRWVGSGTGLDLVAANQGSYRLTTRSWRDYKLMLAYFYATMLACSYAKHRSIFLC
jgi:hypothetical protein